MITALVILAALLYFPALRHAVGAFVWGALAFVSLTLVFGEAGALAAFGVGCVAFVRGFYRA